MKDVKGQENMANIDHPDHIWTVDQFNTYCEGKSLPMKIVPAEASGGTYQVYKSDVFQVMENDTVQIPMAQGEAQAVMFAVDRLKEKWLSEDPFTHRF